MLRQVEYHGDNAVGKTITHATLYSSEIRLVFSDGTFINAELHGYGGEDHYMVNEEITFLSNLAGGQHNPWSAGQLLEQGIITQQEHDDFVAEYNQQQRRADRLRENRERQEYERLKQKFGS